jgi:hypothetical protein
VCSEKVRKTNRNSSELSEKVSIMGENVNWAVSRVPKKSVKLDEIVPGHKLIVTKSSQNAPNFTRRNS